MFFRKVYSTSTWPSYIQASYLNQRIYLPPKQNRAVEPPTTGNAEITSCLRTIPRQLGTPHLLISPMRRLSVIVDGFCRYFRGTLCSRILYRFRNQFLQNPCTVLSAFLFSHIDRLYLQTFMLRISR